MKKSICLIALLFAVLSSVSAQVKIGLLVSPTINFNRVGLNTEEKGKDISADGAGIGFIGGPELSYFFGSGENYSITTGAWYAVKRSKYIITTTQTDGTKTDSARNTVLQYLQIPLTFKLYTNEIATDMKLYFQIGGTADILVGGKESGSKVRSTKGYRPFDSSIILGTGVKYALGENTAVLIGLRYTRGLINALDNTFRDNYKVNNDMISIDLGIQF